ncbi:serine/threonine-protein kinase [Actinoallomurus sp. NPDC052308]|uniref:serine/threonine-protein kinase n=1 Tax=Actinoallomurus sp. NPDC052308 TaxID=3155530 RepID=UPI00343A0C76
MDVLLAKGAWTVDADHLLGGRYRLVREIGAGGFGRVWQARDEELRVDVAVKEVWLPPATSVAEHGERLTRAKREARNAARLRGHPNIVAVHDVLTVDDAPWIVMDLVRGHSLEQRIAERGRLPVNDTAGITAALLNALAAAHDAGITHRDVKPANVLLAEDGRVLLTDFGIAEHHADTGLTASGTIVGSVEYIAPERLDGKDAGPAGDLFSLGATLYHAVEGASAFRRDTPTATITAVLLRDPPPPAHAGPLTTLITRLLDKDPHARPDIAETRRLLDTPHAGEATTRLATKRLTAPAATKAPPTRADRDVGKSPARPSPAPKQASPRKNPDALRYAGGVIALIILGIIFVPKFIHHNGTSGMPAGCADVRTAWGRHNETVRTGTGSNLAPGYRQLGDDMGAAAQKANDPNGRSVIQDLADASHAIADDVEREHAGDNADASDYNRDMSKWATANNQLIGICQ